MCRTVCDNKPPTSSSNSKREKPPYRGSSGTCLGSSADRGASSVIVDVVRWQLMYLRRRQMLRRFLFGWVVDVERVAFKLPWPLQERDV